MEYKKILVMTDFSKDSNLAVETAAALAMKFGAELSVLHVAHDEAHFDLYVFEKELDAINRKIIDEAEASFCRLEEEVPLLKEVTWDSLVRRGVPYEEGLHEIESKSYDLLVIGSHGKRGVKRFLYGTTAEKMIRNCPVSVHVTRHECTGLKK
ncbi:universal stress protein [Geovibrio thiophilus]|uniref:Universal stress protein n=1 Tax=Geovibrio thiophilus TaxID=139438 RepID=A0A410JYL1_9BACT|nr:universal stress protein [Geovibrio thiophilus]QAR33141.1 universal stress protein [Geovibrio thiophilus]